MKASTHTEVYRRFSGRLRRFPLRPLVLARSGLRNGFKRKLPALLLFGPIGISTVVNAFKVHLGYVLEERRLTGGDPRAALGAGMVQQVLGRAVDNVLQFLDVSAVFGLIAISWYGAGLIAEDRRLGANLLYFSRPLTRWGYCFGKFLAAFAFGALATVVPCLVICFVASFSSPEWSFLRQEWDVILGSIAFSAFCSATIAVLVLAVSSLVTRKTHALVGIVGLVVLSGGVSEVMSRLAREPRLALFGLFENFQRLGRWMLKGQVDPDLGISPTLLVLGAIWVAALGVFLTRVRKLEVVA